MLWIGEHNILSMLFGHLMESSSNLLADQHFTNNMIVSLTAIHRQNK